MLTLVDKQIASVGDYLHQLPLISTPSRLWIFASLEAMQYSVNIIVQGVFVQYGTMVVFQDFPNYCGYECHYICTIMEKSPAWGLSNTNTTIHPHLQDSMDKLPVWGTINTNAIALHTPHLQDSMDKLPVWGTMNTRLDQQVPVWGTIQCSSLVCHFFCLDQKTIIFRSCLV